MKKAIIGFLLIILAIVLVFIWEAVPNCDNILYLSILLGFGGGMICMTGSEEIEE